MTEAADLFEQAARRAPDPRLAARDICEAAYSVAFNRTASMRSSRLMLDAAALAQAAGDADLRAILTAMAVTIGRRIPGRDGVAAQTSDACEAMLAEASAGADPGSALVTAHLAVARAWNSAASYSPDRELAIAAVSAARAAGDLVLLSAALDVGTFAADNAGLYREGFRAYQERLNLLPEMSRDDPRAAFDIIDIIYMASRSAVSVGSPAAALTAIRLALAEELAGQVPFLTVTLPIVPLTLSGEFGDAIRRSTAAWHAWTVDPSQWLSGWLALDLLASSLAGRLLGDRTAATKWRHRFEEVIAGRDKLWEHCESFATFVAARVALAEQPPEPAGARAIVERAFADFAHKHHAAYAHAAGAELAVVAGLPGASDLLAVLAQDAKQNDWARAAHLRAAGRLRQDTGALRAAADAWQDIGARYEHAATLLLIPDRAAEGRTSLAALGVTGLGITREG